MTYMTLMILNVPIPLEQVIENLQDDVLEIL